MNSVIHPDFENKSVEITAIIENFTTQGTLFIDGKRNKIKLFELGNTTVNVKSFKVPNVLNKLVYRFFRKSKAQRSYEFANILLQNGIGTPQPIAYFENRVGLSLKDSYYMSEQLEADLTFRKLIEVTDYPEHEIILRQFTQFTFKLHEKGIAFLDHTPGNTLIKKVGHEQYEFFLVDLNRMQFHTKMNLEQRVINMAKLTPETDLITVMSDEYAKLYGCTYNEVFRPMVKHTQYFANRFHRKRAIKRKLGLRKK
ncbi:lipopolysaccharide kinase InaA family protein [Flavobacterium litorale]|uniref:Lipopolysaccharide kinase InaA family protein n=1 Tax=Flavobacterium litorale TaxID=2856519 RepID=A0ABX8V3N6_9FLAO|nr:lipopolysaccharide kinase InaA family protein [Flavobacterium litorale]QYJ67458.1 lipopolysaccharide kinase InaA family protein [Flavobacterium litorale]